MSARSRHASDTPNPGSERVAREASLPTQPRAALATLVARLQAPIDNSTIVLFRIAFGFLMLWEVQRYLSYGWVASEYIDTVYRFPYVGFEWVQPWPGIGMYLHYYALAILAVCIAIGFFYRISATLFFLGITYIFLLDKAHFLNHMYLVSLISFLMIFIPANRDFSVDAHRRPSIRSTTAPTWALALLAFQVGIVYVYGGFAKLNGDWLRGEPMRTWLADESDLPLVGRWVTEEWFVYVVSYSGLFLDLFIVPLLLWPKTRWFAVAALVLFHRFNAAMFSIGIFPMFATAALVLFLPPEWPRRAAMWLRSTFEPQHRRTVPKRDKGRKATLEPTTSSPVMFSRRAWIQPLAIAGITVYVAFQLLFPLRHYLYPGNPAWTDQGDRFAWRMMLHSKVGDLQYVVTDPQSGTTWDVDPATYLTDFQIGNMVGQPDMILQFGHFLADEWRADGYNDVEVQANTSISLNARESVPIVDPSVDLAAQDLPIGNASWITSLDEQQQLASQPDDKAASD